MRRRSPGSSFTPIRSDTRPPELKKWPGDERAYSSATMLGKFHPSVVGVPEVDTDDVKLVSSSVAFLSAAYMSGKTRSAAYGIAVVPVGVVGLGTNAALSAEGALPIAAPISR